MRRTPLPRHRWPHSVLSAACALALAAAALIFSGCSQNEYAVKSPGPAPVNPRNAHVVKKGDAGMNNAAAPEEEMPAPQETPAMAGANVFSGTVILPPALAKQFRPGETLFVILRDTKGKGAPLAALKLTAQSFPLAFQLTDDNSMMGEPLPASGEILLRLDADGNLATSGPDDLVGGPVPAKAGQPLTLALEAPRP